MFVCSYVGPSNIAINRADGLIKPREFGLYRFRRPFGVSTVLPDNQTHIYTRNGGGHTHRMLDFLVMLSAQLFGMSAMPARTEAFPYAQKPNVS